MPAYSQLFEIVGSPRRPHRPEFVDRWAEWALGARRIEPGVAQRVRILSRLAAAEHVSGEELARALDASRAAVHKHVDKLRADGLDVRSLKGRGYALRLTGDELIPEAALLPLMSTGPPFGGADASGSEMRVFGLPYQYRRVVGSTNSWIREKALEGAPAGTLAVTDHQVEGKGRLGRAWISEAGKDLTFSLLLRPRIPAGAAHLVVLCAAAAVASVVEELAGGEELRVQIKWPNDVLLDGGKVCGILAEGVADMDGLEWVALGVGLNANGDGPAKVFGRTGAFPPISLANALGSPVPRALLLVRVISSFSWWWGRVEMGSFEAVVGACRRRDVLRSRFVRVRVGGVGGDSVIEGEAVGLGDRGELLVQPPGGEVAAVSAGEVTMVQ